MLRYFTILFFCCFLHSQLSAQSIVHTDVLVIGGGTSGTAAAIQSARMGVSTVLVEEGPWLGGMLSAAGVSAIDGNHKMPSGIWNEFREKIYKVYGGASKVATGWVSNTHFEPHVGDSILKAMVSAIPNLKVFYHYQFSSVIKTGNTIKGAKFSYGNKQLIIHAKQTIDATEMGDVIASAGARFDVGLEASSVSGEDVGIERSANIIQDLTYVAILKDYGKTADKTIPQPANYNPSEFDGSSTDYYHDKNRKAPNVDAQKMLDYGKLPNNKYMLNWPAYGNDYYVNMIGMSAGEKVKAIEAAKLQTLRFIYFIQHTLGFKHLGLADDEFPTTDRLALMPYHRESRRVKGLIRFNIKHLSQPFDYTLYRTGIAVGDYPIDHHHRKNADAPQHIDFYPVPSYNVPLGALIPIGINGLIAAEKNISVSNVVNGTTRLQPVVLLIGQAAGTLAALSVKEKKQPANISIRKVQTQLLDNGAMIMPYIDAGIHHPQFKSIQKVGATGILKGKGVPYQWANQTWFYPDSTITEKMFLQGLQSFEAAWLKNVKAGDVKLTTDKACDWLLTIMKSDVKLKRSAAAITKAQMITKLKDQNLYSDNILRKTMAWLLDEYIRPFNRNLNHLGKLYH